MAVILKISIITDTWKPNINGVVRTLSYLRENLILLGYEVEIISPDQFISVGCPGYSEIKLAMFPSFQMWSRLKNTNAIHIASEGPLGRAARRYCLLNNISFTTSFHTKLAEYAKIMLKIPENLGYMILRNFHAPSKRILVPTKSIKKELRSKGFRHITVWKRGADVDLFRPKEIDLPYKKPIHLFVGRVSADKNLESFLSLDLPGTKLIVGDGPILPKLKNKFKDAVFVGYKEGEELANYYAGSDVFVFPSRLDTFGLVQLEALASGLPVVAYPVAGPIDVIGNNERIGCLNNDLKFAIEKALTLSSQDCRTFALQFSWMKCAKDFLKHLEWRK